MKNIRTILEDEKSYLTVFWLVLAGTAVFFSYLTLLDWTEAMNIARWVETDCKIIESYVEEEGGEDWADLFIVAYQYEWGGELITANVYGIEYSGESYYPDPNTLVNQYPVGSLSKCYVNPENPSQAVLEKESILTIFFLLFLVVLFVISVIKLIATWNPAFGLRLKSPPETKSEAILRNLWKPIKWVVMTFGMILFLSIGLWAVIGLAGLLFIFFGFPLLFASAMTKQMKEVGDDLAKLQSPHEGGLITGSGKPKLHFSMLEKVIIVISITIFVLIMLFFIKHIKWDGPGSIMWGIFGVMFHAMWFGGAISMLTYGVLRGIRQYRKNKIQKKDESYSSRKHVSIGFEVVNILITALGIIGFGGFLAGGVCAFITISGEPRVSSWARFPLGGLETIAVDSHGNLYCGINFYSRIQVYSSEGEFIRGWFLDAGGGVFRIKIDDEDRLHAGTARGDYYYIFSTEGELLSAREMSPKEEERIFGKTYYSPVSDRNGNIYGIKKSLLLPGVIKTDARGQESTVVSDPFILWFIKGPFPAWLWLAGAILLGGGLNVCKKMINRYRLNRLGKL